MRAAMTVVLIERLSERTFADHASLIARADLCIPLTVSSGTTVTEAMRDPRWWKQDLPFLEATAAGHALWVHRLVQAQTGKEDGIPVGYDALVEYGLEARLRFSVLAQALVRRAAAERGYPLDRIDLHVLGDDPYLRATFPSKAVASGSRTVTLLRTSRARSWMVGLRERAAGDPSVRRLVAMVEDLRRWSDRSAESLTAGAIDRTAALFIQNTHQLALFRPVREKLLTSGWRLEAFSYRDSGDRPGEAESFARAVRRTSSDRPHLRMPVWRLSETLLRSSPVPEGSLRVALNASWITGWEQVGLHRRLLAARRPRVVVSLTTDTAALGLQVAAASLDIPSLYVNHGPLGPVFSQWFFRWTAMALAGPPCVEANLVGPFGDRNSALVPVGFPPYDSLLIESTRIGSAGRALPDLGQPGDRPYLVIAFAEYGHQPWVHSTQDRLLRTLAAALPSDCFLVCKLHPAGEHERDACERILASLLPTDAFAVVDEARYTTPQLLAACHVAVAIERCGALIDAIFMARPAIGLRVPEIPPGSSNLNQLDKLPMFWDCCRIVEDREALRNALIALTRDPAAREALVRGRRRYIETFFLASDGRASDRIADLIRHLGEGGDPDRFVPVIDGSLIGS